MKEKVLGGKKENEGPAVVRDPKTKALVFHPSAIRRVSVKYCKDLLTNRKPSEEFRDDIEWKKRVHEVRMNEKLNDDIEFNEEMFSNTFNLLKKSKKDKYKFILEGGQSYLASLFKLYQVVWEGEKKPDSWRDSVVIQLDKGKKDKADLDNRRNIHTKEQTVKFFGHMVANSAKPKIVENISEFQIGAIPGHRA